ncbi:CDP-diacylglycerol--glycerol-3-phosphate 3-phosphatidyltransferase [Hyphobacterium marinum]|uniref:CDP-diacylglycerol--glycerol-3-phosphate 3-phosphatidyltransferase n=1 Tax=Hyphobacterium marinum TaxID=3116574 RepID=A0ABU7M0S2_9PROT|nr:CDP-diacylglycerol--glycerol-3-phosphate 3-phosphatidyltransferase [Hyphobacterium sp. Y6023]MEE2567424.1 CDP-diacylglycerol--glycerol-3-phosphate 3-phosphatidyltransferase [Hyphobacterium sp. Y6023]
MIRQIPNILTLLRCAAGPAGAVCLWISASAASEADAEQWWLYALILFIAGAITDGLDGWLARKLNAVSNFGAVIDPIADKIFVASFLVVFVLMADGWIMIAAPVAAILARDVVMTGVRFARLGQSSNPLPVTFSAKMKTVMEMAAIGWFFLLRILVEDGGSWAYETWIVLLWLAAALSLYTGLGYLLPRRGKSG